MNIPQKPNHSNNEPEQPIDAEIISETPNSDRSESVDLATINLIYQPSDEEFIPEKSSDALPQWLKQALAPLSTPWGLASLSLIVISNLLLCSAWLWQAQQFPTTETSTNNKTENKATEALSIPKSLNLARKSQDTLSLEGLSTVSLPASQSSKPQKPTATAPQKPVAANVVNVNQPLSLSNAILPPSLQPQAAPNNQAPSTPLPVPVAPKTNNPPPLPISSLPRPVPPAQPMAIEPPPPPSANLAVSEDEKIRQGIQEQLKMEERTQQNAPLGFNHKTRLELQNGMNKVPPELLPQQVNYLEQLQQRRVIDSVE